MTDPERTVRSLHDRAEQIRGAELARARTLSPAGREALEVVTARVVREFLRLPATRVQEDGDRYAAVLRHLFDLEDAA